MVDWQADGWRKDAWQHWTAKAREDWPPDSETQTYLCRAVDPVGEAMFGSNWTGNEFHEHLDICLSKRGDEGALVWLEQVEASKDQKELVCFLLREYCEVGQLAYLAPESLAAVAPFTDQHWQLGRQLVERENKRREASRARAKQVIVKIQDVILKGKAGFGFREIDGGSIETFYPSGGYWPAELYWNGENLAPRFAYGQINLKEPFGPFARSPFHDLSPIDRARKERRRAWRYVYVEATRLSEWIGRHVAADGQKSSQPQVAQGPDVGGVQVGARPITSQNPSMSGKTVVSSRFYSPAKVAEWLFETYMNLPQPPQTKVVAAAKAAFPGIGRDAVRKEIDAHRDALHWTTKPGPRGPRNVDIG
jgi:hypothetical protein